MLSLLFIQILSLCTYTQSQGQYHPFLTLGTTAGVIRHYLPEVNNGASESILIPGGFYFGRTSKTVVYVSSNGYFSLGSEETQCCPVPFSSTSYPEYIVAPFWADIDTNLGGSISYEVHRPSVGSYSNTLLDQVSAFISSQQNTRFVGNWMLLASWEQVPKYQGSSSTTNTFQGILITNGISSYAVFTYECGAIGWGGGATIGYKATGSFYQNHALSGSGAASIGCVNSPESQWSNVVYQLNDDQAVCDPLCENGGSCTAPGICSCTSEWTGEYCQIDLDNLGQKQLLVTVLGSIIGGLALTSFVCFMFLFICCCTTSCPLHRTYCRSATPRSHSRTRGTYVALQNSSCTQDLELPPPPSPPPSYSETRETTQPPHSRTCGIYVALQNLSDTQDLLTPTSPPPSYSETGETTQLSHSQTRGTHVALQNSSDTQDLLTPTSPPPSYSVYITGDNPNSECMNCPGTSDTIIA